MLFAMSTLLERFGKRVRMLRKARGWTQEKLASRCGRHWTYVGGLERGQRNPTLEVMADLARALGVDMWQLLKEDDVPRDRA